MEGPSGKHPGRSRFTGERALCGCPRREDKNGYITWTWKYNGTQVWVYEHRLVMERELGRELLPGENVHHLNGDRFDNEPSNLELWSTSQPHGQRVADKVSWAKELLRLYEPGALSLG